MEIIIEVELSTQLNNLMNKTENHYVCYVCDYN